MDKYEYNLKLEEIDKLVDQGNYEEAAGLADTIDWRRVRNIRTLCLISEIYEASGRLEDSKNILVRAYRRSPVGRTVLFLNIVIYTVAGTQFGFDPAMYSLLTYYITSKVLDFIDNGMNQAKAATIITNDGRKIADMIYRKMGRTVTLMEGEGLISGKKDVVYCVLNRLEVYELKKLIGEADTGAFIAINEISEIIGNHIKKKGGEG